MKIRYQQIFEKQEDGIIIIHQNDEGGWTVGGINSSYYPDNPNEIYTGVEDRYPLNEETKSILFEEIENLIKMGKLH